MKHLSEYITEGIFGDNIKSAIEINGVKIYEPDWKKCEEFFEKRRQQFVGKKYVELGDMQTEHEVIYCEKDCVICKNIEETDYDEIYILCPETIYMNHETDELCNDKWCFSLITVSDANDYSIAFVYYGDNKTWSWLEGCDTIKGRRISQEQMGINRGYIPLTISQKAENIIKKYTRG